MNKNKLGRSFVVSLLLHLSPLLLLLFLGGGNGKGKGGFPPGSDLDKFQPKPDRGGELSVELMTYEDDMALKKKKEQMKKRKKDCEGDWYGGIGVSQGIGSTNDTVIVTEVAPGYAADRAGVRVGDTLQSTEELRGNPGTSVSFRITSLDGSVREVTVVREKICYKKLASPKEEIRPGYEP